ncbi:Solute carrier family 2, facilitated glucose transporter member 3 [Pseudolycoriella hygida]|uniref:Solute carrier family 2, facilitated glucose transporter member 3 n=1 Tax=Pseudolycoriella hygida TaxID=35572 RepID=A0A9Q0MS07_9DIPT|nr:Solute carrier family 2, facilitated glucose transporter member 3 [Pseudolycoriella hygida]
MEKEDHKKELHSTIHPTLAVYLSGNFNDQPVHSFNSNSSSNGEGTKCSAYLEKLSKNRLQSSSVVGGLLILLVSGLHIGWGIWRIDFNEPWFQGISGVFIFIVLSFYVGAIIGGIMTGFIINIWRKQAIYYLSGSIMVISSLISIIWCSNQMGILFCRVMAGLGHGLAYNVVIVHAGDNSMKKMRGIITSNINCFLWFSTFFGSLLIATVQMGVSTTISSDRMIGIFGLVFSVLALTYTMFWTEESVVYLLNRGKLGEALELLSKLRNEPEASTSVADDFEEMRLMVNRDKLENQNIFLNNNEKPLGLMVALKFLHILTNNFMINWIFMIITTGILPRGNRRLSPVILSAVRFIGSFIQTFLGDSFGRKTFLNTSCTLAGVTVLILEILLIAVTDYTQATYGLVSALCIAFQFFVAFGIDPMHNVILSEAFSTSKKNWSLVFVNTCENVAHMLLIGICFVDGVIFSSVYHLVLFISVTFILILIVILVFYLPETQGLSLGQSRDAFRNITTRCSWYRR